MLTRQTNVYLYGYENSKTIIYPGRHRTARIWCLPIFLAFGNRCICNDVGRAGCCGSKYCYDCSRVISNCGRTYDPVPKKTLTVFGSGRSVFSLFRYYLRHKFMNGCIFILRLYLHKIVVSINRILILLSFIQHQFIIRND